MKTQNLKSVITGLVATTMIACFTISTHAKPIYVSKTDTGKMDKTDKMSADKMSEGKMAKKDTASKM